MVSIYAGSDFDERRELLRRPGKKIQLTAEAGKHIKLYIGDEGSALHRRTSTGCSIPTLPESAVGNIMNPPAWACILSVKSPISWITPLSWNPSWAREPPLP